MTLRIGSTAPDFTAETTHGRIRLHEWIAGSWAVLFSHPKDFTAVCTTELGRMATLSQDFARRECKVIGLGTDPVDSHIAWSRDLADVAGAEPGYPIIADTDLAVAKLYGMLPEEEAAGPRTAAQNATVRTLFVIDPAQIIRLTIAYPMTCGRNFAEILRVLDSLCLTERAGVSTPADWTHGADVLLPSTLDDAAARRKFPNGWRAPKPYLRFVPQPA